MFREVPHVCGFFRMARMRFRHLAFVALVSLLVCAAGHSADLSQTLAPGSSNSVVVSSEFRRGRAMVRARVNDSASMLFLLDSGFTINMISPEQAAALGLKRTGTITIVGIAGEEPADVFEGVTLDFGGNLTYTSRRIASLPSQNRRSARRDGVLGSSFYRQFTIEIDYPEKRVVLHRPESFEYKGNGEIIPLRFRRSTAIVSAAILFTNQTPVSGDFEIDTGCDGGLCLAHDFVERTGLEAKIAAGQRSARQGVGGEKRTREVRLPQLQIGKLIVERPTADLFEQGSPAGEGMAGHIGVEVLRQFRVIFDYSQKRIILERPGVEGLKR